MEIPLYKRTTPLIVTRPAVLDDPAGYLPEPGLIEAVNVALLLGKPLLITGEPGTGKTQLAWSLAWDMGLGENREPYVFTAKHNSVARDLLYRYDALQHFAEANQARIADRVLRPIQDFIFPEALGKAIREAHTRQGRAVVLIDEIDKAPREFPNDLLAELERLSFHLFETGETFTAPPDLRPVVIITSNGEKNLPDAFLRRCVYYHIQFPDRARLLEIVQTRLGAGLRYGPDDLEILIDHFLEIRALCRKKQPATADLLSWLQVLEAYGFSGEIPPDLTTLTDPDRDVLFLSFSVLAKHLPDLEALRARYADTANPQIKSLKSLK
ncbi:MAG: MoxR family ATPase [Bacteroidia bacterium]|nr:MoxR family ATPase [Bacteroidia bacterium]